MTYYNKILIFLFCGISHFYETELQWVTPSIIRSISHCLSFYKRGFSFFSGPAWERTSELHNSSTGCHVPEGDQRTKRHVYAITVPNTLYAGILHVWETKWRDHSERSWPALFTLNTCLALDPCLVSHSNVPGESWTYLPANAEGKILSIKQAPQIQNKGNDVTIK